MFVATINLYPDYDEWRSFARAALSQNIHPRDLIWQHPGQFSLLPLEKLQLNHTPRAIHVSREFIELSKTLILARVPERFSLPYEILWELQCQPYLLRDKTHPLMVRAGHINKAIRRDIHKMRAFVRFREIKHDDEICYLSWFEPEHFIAAANASFFMRRFSNMNWSILTPDQSIHWDQQQLFITTGAQKSDVPDDDQMESYWRAYFTHIFNPARLKIKAMTKEMPKKYWHNLPEANLIPELIQQATTRTAIMISQAPSAPQKKWQHMQVIDNQLQK